MGKHVNLKAMQSAASLHVHANMTQPRADDSAGVATVIAKLNTEFEAFKNVHAEQQAEIKKGFEDVVTTEKFEKVNASVSELQAAVDAANSKLESIALGSGGDNLPKDPEYTANFQKFMVSGVEANLTKAPDSDGGYLAPTEWDRTITGRLIEVSPMRQIANVQRISVGSFKRLYKLGAPASGWVGETTSRDETGTPTFAQLEFALGEIYANPAATTQLLDDSELDLEQWLASEVQTEFDLEEGLAFIAGNGVNKPYGFLTFVEGQANAARHPFGAISKVPVGSPDALGESDLLDMVYGISSAYAGNGRFVMNRATQGEVRKIEDADGRKLWQPSAAAGQPSTLSGQPITEMPGMPDISPSAIPIAFGDFQRGYRIIDGTGIRVLRDPFTQKPFVTFYTTKRVGGGVDNPEALIALEMAAS